MSRFQAVSIVIVLVYVITTGLLAQDQECLTDTFDRLAQIKNTCSETMRNQVCYGNIEVSAVPQPNVLDFQFGQPGDLSDVAALKSLSLSTQAVSEEAWGIVLMELLANISADEPEDVRVVLFGNVELENAALERVGIDATVNTTAHVNIRRQPATSFGAVGTLAPNTVARAIGRLADASWVRVVNPDTNVSGWVSTHLLDLEGDVESLMVEEATAPYFGPMQAFYLTSGTSACNNVPLDGLFIQTPEGVGRVSMWVNEVTIDFLSNVGGSTSVIKQPDETEMVIQLLEGAAVISDGETGEIVVPAGTEVHVPLNPDGTLAGSPEMPVPYDDTGLTQLALAAGYRKVEAAPPATVEAIASANLINASNSQEVTKCTPDTCGVDEEGDQESEGYIFNPIAPIQSTCSGDSCEPPPHPSTQISASLSEMNEPCTDGRCDSAAPDFGYGIESDE